MGIFLGKRLGLRHHFRDEVVVCNLVDSCNEVLMVKAPLTAVVRGLVAYLRHQEALKTEEPVQILDRPHNGIARTP